MPTRVKRNRRRPPARHPHSRTACALPLLGLALAAPLPLHAQGQDVALERVVITGQAAATDRALKDQAAADNVVSVVRSDGIGRLPDKNAAEALQRLPGVSIERDQGEGRYVRIRGLGPDLNTVTLNGSLVPSPERDRRAVMLDVLPSSLVRALVVTKTLTPDQDANSLGGTVDVQTLSAFDQAGRFLVAEVGLGHETNTHRRSPNGSLAWSNRFLDGRLGVAAGLSLDQRKFGSDNVETGGAWDGDALEGFERRDYRITRERAGAVLNLEWKPEEGTLYYARTLASRYSDDEIRQSHAIEFAEPQVEGALGQAESVRELKARKETQAIRSVVLGGQRRLQDWDAKLALGLGRSSEDTPLHIAAATFEADPFADVGFRDGRRPVLVAPEAINSAAPYALTGIELERTHTVDTERNLRVDLGRSIDVAGHTTDLKFGAKVSQRRKTSEQTTWVLEDFEDAPFLLDPAQLGLGNFSSGSVGYPWGSFGPAINAGPLLGLAQGVDLAPFVDEEESTVNDFRMRERIRAAYVQAGFDVGAYRLLAGVRHEGTELHAQGAGVQDGEFAPIAAAQRHEQWLPGLHLRRELDPRTSLRAAWTRSVVRPTFGQLAPGFVIDGDEAAFGNPGLQPLRSTNLDLGVERSLGYAGVVSAYAFHKRIRNFIFQTDVAGTGAFADFAEAITFANGDKASVSGLELAHARTWRELPAPWNGLVTAANATFSRSSARIARFDAEAGAEVSRRIPLPSQSSRVFNLVLGYEAEPLDLRLAVNHKSRYLLEVSDVLDASRDLVVDGQTQLDLSVRYALGARSALVFEALNLTDTPYFVYTGNDRRNAQYETYGRTWRLNLKRVFE